MCLFDQKAQKAMPADLHSTLLNLLRQPNDIMILGCALLFYGTYQLFRKAS
jgi:hypothetical protein